MPDKIENPEAAALRRELGFVPFETTCAALGVTPATGANRITQGKFPPTYKVGRGKFCRVEEVQKWILRQRRSRDAA